MKLEVRQADITTVEADAIIVNLFEGVTKPGGATGAVDEATNGLLSDHIKDHEFDGKTLDTLVLHSPSGVKTKHIIVIGLGRQAAFTPVTARKVAAKSIQKARELKAKVVATIIHGAGIGGIDTILASEMTVEGLLLGNYRFDRYKTKERKKYEKERIEKVLLVEHDKNKLNDIQIGLSRGEAIANAILNTRDIINESPTKITPSSLVQAAKEIASLSDSMGLTILDEKQLQKEGYNALLAVAAGSEKEAYLIHLHYKPKGVKQSIAFVGKGVTFDSGGLGIKPWSAMLTMKSDMAGAGAVLGIFQALAELEAAGMPLETEVHGIIPTTENMISGSSMRPDDIIETKSGKTIEITHTDAEGRLILSDALTYATYLRPDAMVDFATLTGAAIRALGRSYAVSMGNDRQLLDTIRMASEETGELAWELPLPKEYEKYIESPVADIQNSANSENAPGAIIGGLFLQEFVREIPWTHLDIAGPSWQDDDTNPVYPKGASGYGVLLGLKLLEILKG